MRIALVDPKTPFLEEHVTNVKESLEEEGHQVILIEASNNLLNVIERARPLDLIFNLSDGMSDKRMQANMVGMLEFTNIPILGSGLNTQIVGLHKGITKALLQAHGIPTSNFQLIKDEAEEIDEELKFPVIVKPEHEGSGVGVTASSKVDSAADLQAVISEKIVKHQQMIIVEEFLPGREFTVGVMGNQKLTVLPIQEAFFPKDGPQILTSEIKAIKEIMVQTPADISDELQTKIERLAVKTFRLLRCEDYIRIDFRLDEQKQPSIIEINTHPGLIEDFSYFPIIAKVAGYSYARLLNELVELAVRKV